MKSVWDAAKRDDITDTQAAFIEWLVDPERTGTQNAWAKAHDVQSSTCTRWKQEKRFVEAWDARLRALNVNPDRIQAVVNAMHAKAVGGDMKAAELYLRYTEKFLPTTKKVIEDRSVKDMSDDELAEALEDDATHLRAVGE